MLYRFIKFLVHRVLVLFFEHIYFNGLKNIPKDKPVIIAGTHTYGLVDPLLALAILPRPHYSMTRADIFNSNLKKWLLNKVYLVPIFRARDGGDTVQKNRQTFQKVNEVLAKNQGILIFPEGSCVMSKQVQPLKKGTARMAFNLMTEKGIDVYVVPTGINYSDYEQPRIDAYISFGQPIQVSKYWSDYEENPAKTLRLFNQDLQKAIEQEMVTFDEELKETIEQALILQRTPLELPKWNLYQNDSKERLTIEQKTANKIEQIATTRPAVFEKFKNTINAYFVLLKDHQVEDAALFKTWSIKEKVLLGLGCILMFIPSLISKGFGIGQMLEKKVRKTLSTTDNFFYGSFYLVYILFSLLGFLGISWIGFGIVFKSGLLGFITALVGVFWIYSYVKFESFWKKSKAIKKVKYLKKTKPNVMDNILSKRCEVMAFLDS